MRLAKVVKLSKPELTSACAVGSLSRWDLCQAVFLIYIALTVPWRIGFGQPAEAGTFWFIFDLGIDIYFWVDLVLVSRLCWPCSPVCSPLTHPMLLPVFCRPPEQNFRTAVCECLHHRRLLVIPCFDSIGSVC